MIVRIIAFSALCAALAPVTPTATLTAQSQQGAAAIDSLSLARKWSEWLYKNQLDSLVDAFEPDSRNLETQKSLERTLTQLVSRGGNEVSVVEEKFVKRNGYTQYWRIAKFALYDAEPIVLRWAVNPKWQIIGIGINPLSASPPVDK